VYYKSILTVSISCLVIHCNTRFLSTVAPGKSKRNLAFFPSPFKIQTFITNLHLDQQIISCKRSPFNLESFLVNLEKSLVCTMANNLALRKLVLNRKPPSRGSLFSLRVRSSACSLRNSISYMVSPQEENDIAQIILKSVSKNILRRLSILFRTLIIWEI